MVSICAPGKHRPPTRHWVAHAELAAPLSFAEEEAVAVVQDRDRPAVVVGQELSVPSTLGIIDDEQGWAEW
jgi:hypothetical protein